MQNPGKTRGSLVAALSSNRAFDMALLEWWLDSEHATFSSWAFTDGYWPPTAGE